MFVCLVLDLNLDLLSAQSEAENSMWEPFMYDFEVLRTVIDYFCSFKSDEIPCHNRVIKKTTTTKTKTRIKQ